VTYVERFRTIEVVQTDIPNQYRIYQVVYVTDGVAETTVRNTQTATLPATTLADNQAAITDALDTAAEQIDGVIAALT